jgi:type II secretory pathway component GspD/PulD (secretin)
VQSIADTKTLPPAWRLSSAESVRFNNYDLDVWRIELAISVAPNKTAQILVRDQKIRVRPASNADGRLINTSDSAMIVIPLKNASAASIAEVLDKAIAGKWLETKVTADARTNSLIVLAPKSKEESIRQTVRALDELQK